NAASILNGGQRLGFEARFHFLLQPQRACGRGEAGGGMLHPFNCLLVQYHLGVEGYPRLPVVLGRDGGVNSVRCPFQKTEWSLDEEIMEGYGGQGVGVLCTFEAVDGGMSCCETNLQHSSSRTDHKAPEDMIPKKWDSTEDEVVVKQFDIRGVALGG